MTWTIEQAGVFVIWVFVILVACALMLIIVTEMKLRRWRKLDKQAQQITAELLELQRGEAAGIYLPGYVDARRAQIMRESFTDEEWTEYHDAILADRLRSEPFYQELLREAVREKLAIRVE